MTIVYSLVSREKTVLAEYTSTSGACHTVPRRTLGLGIPLFTICLIGAAHVLSQTHNHPFCIKELEENNSTGHAIILKPNDSCFCPTTLSSQPCMKHFECFFFGDILLDVFVERSFFVLFFCCCYYLLFSIYPPQIIISRTHFPHVQATGNFPTVTRVLLAKIPSQDGRMSYVYDEHIFHYVVENGICFLCMSDELNKHRVPFAFLNDMKQLFVTKYGLELPQRAIAFSFNDEFSRIIAERMEYYNGSNPSLDSISTVQNQINDVKDVMVLNIEKVLERGDKIELLVDKTDRLNQQAFKFESSSRTLRRAVWWKKARGMACMGLVLTLLIYFVSASVCGVTFSKCRT